MLPYGDDVLFALYRRFLLELWPIALPLAVLTVAALPAALRFGTAGARFAAIVMGFAWIWVGAVFHLQYFATINFAAPVYGWLFVLQGLLILGHGVRHPRFTLTPTFGHRRASALLVITFAVIAYPVLDQLDGASAWPLRLVALAPAPTALFTLGLLALAEQRIPTGLWIIPVGWSAVAGYNGWVLGLPADLATPVVALLVLLSLRTGRPRTRSTTG